MNSNQAHNVVWLDIVNAFSDVVILTDINGNILQINKAGENFIGIPFEKMIGKLCCTFINGSEKRLPNCPMQKMLEAGQRVTDECCLSPGKWISITIEPVKNEKGEIVSAVHIVCDISQNKKIENALRESEEKYRSVIENANIGVIVIQDNNIVYYNSKFSDMLGYSDNEIKNINFMSKVHAEDKAYAADRIRKRMEGIEIKPEFAQFRVLTKSGRIKWIETNSTLIQWGGRPALQSFLTDITDRKNAESALAESEQKFKNIFENASDAITYLDYTGKILDLNKQAVQIQAGSKEELVNKHFTKINVLSFKEIPKYLKLFKSILTGKKTTVTVDVFNKKGDKRFLECSASLIKSENGPARIMVISRDITERIQSDARLRDNEQRLQSIIDHSIELFYIHDIKHQLTFVSPQCKEILGYAPEEMKVKWTNLITDNPINAKGIELTEKALKTGKRQKAYLLELRRKDGSKRIVEVDESPIKDKKGKVVGITGALRDITERKHAIDALRESEEKFKNLAEQSPNMIFINKKGKVVYTNKRSSEILGYDRDAFYSDDFNFLSLIAPESLEKIRKAFALHSNEQEVEPYEYTLITKEGKRIEAIITTKLIEYEGVKSILGIITDITERKKAEDELRNSEEKWRMLYENLPGGSFVVNKDYIIEDVNDVLCNLTDYKREELVGQSCSIICPKGPHKCPIFDLGKTRIDNDETAVKKKNGQLLPILKSARKIPFAGKEVIVESFQDITERKKVEDELKNSEARYHSLFNNANDAIFIMDFDTFIDCNIKTLEIFGCSSEKILGNTPYDKFSPEFQQDGQNSREKALEKIRLAHNGQPQFFEWRHLRYDGTPFDAEVSLNSIELVGKTYLQALIRDITARKKAEENILKYQEQLKSLASQLTLTEEKERYRIATELHDHISQYLAVSMMKLDELLQVSDSVEKQKIIEQINLWLNHAMEESHSLTFDLSSPILHELGFERAVEAWLEDEVHGKHKIKTEFRSDGLTKVLDDDICILLFRNVRELLFNIIKHSHAKKVKVSISKVSNNIKINVEDDGVGFNHEEVAANAAIKTKFGLFSIRERLEHFGGRIEINSAPGKGCRIILIAPLKK